MPSPFPGMDPYLEDPELWPDLHISLITYIRDALQPVLQPRYRARMDLRLYVARSNRNIYPDVTVVHEEVVAYAPAGVAEPYVITSPVERRREPYIEIIHAASGEVVTAIELLSPANKFEGEGRRQYLHAILIHAYDTGGYAGMIDYTKLPRARMTATEQAWTMNLLQQKGYVISA